jgi:hypothetical protein
VLTIVLTFENGSTERISKVTQWDLRSDGRLIAWNDDESTVVEREQVVSAVPGPLGA